MGEIKEIQSIPIVSFALILGSIFAIMMLIWILLFVILEFSSMTFLSSLNMGITAGLDPIRALILVIVGTIAAFIVGFVVTAVIAIFYNMLAPRIGGIKLELK